MSLCQNGRNGKNKTRLSVRDPSIPSVASVNRTLRDVHIAQVYSGIFHSEADNELL